MRVLFGICGSSVKTNVVVDGSNAQPPVCLSVCLSTTSAHWRARIVGELRSGNYKTLSKSKSRARAANAIFRGEMGGGLAFVSV